MKDQKRLRPGAVLQTFLRRRHRTGTLLYLIVPALLGIVVGLLYPTYAPRFEAMRAFEMMAKFIGRGQIDAFSVEGYFSIPFQHPLVLMGVAVVAAIAPLAMPAADRGRGTLDLLLATPLERGTLMRCLIKHARAVSLLSGIVSTVSALVGMRISEFSPGIEVFDEVEVIRFVMAGVVLASLTFALSGMALIISVLAPDRAIATRNYAVLVSIFFLADVLARLWEAGDWVAYLTPYGYNSPPRVFAAEELFPIVARDAGVLMAIGLILSGFAYSLQSRRKSA